MASKCYRWCATVQQKCGFRDGGVSCVNGDDVREVVEKAKHTARILGGGRITVKNCRTQDVVYVDTVKL